MIPHKSPVKRFSFGPYEVDVTAGELRKHGQRLQIQGKSFEVLVALLERAHEIREEGGEQNIQIAFKEMERVCTFDPLVVLRGRHDSIMADHRGKLASYVISIRERLNDVAQSIRR